MLKSPVVYRVYREAEMSFMFDVDFFHLPSQRQASDGEDGEIQEGRGRVKFVIDARCVSLRALTIPPAYTHICSHAGNVRIIR